jgi:hypothetical protein
MRDFLAFRKMVAPIAIRVVFWLGIVGILALGIMTIVEAGETDWGGEELAMGGTIAGVLILIVGPMIWRVYCELLIVGFHMYETITDMRSIIAKRGQGDESALLRD